MKQKQKTKILPTKFIPNMVLVEGYGHQKRGPIFIVGERPGRQRIKDSNGVAWSGNRSADFIQDLLRKAKKTSSASFFYCTNICNLYSEDENVLDNEKYVYDGLAELKLAIQEHRPDKIICLGKFAQKYVKDFPRGFSVCMIEHPSWVLRFNKGKTKYAKELLEALK